MIFKSASLILVILKIKLILFIFIQVFLLEKLIYDIIIGNKNIKILDKVKFIQ